MLFLIMLVYVLLAGFAGGVLRGVLGIAKDLVTKKDLTINWLWFGVTVLIAGIVGIITASFFSDDLRIAALGGYSGSDLIDGIFKLKLPNLFSATLPKNDSPQKSKTGSFTSQFKPTST